MKRLFYFLIVLSCTLWSCGGGDEDGMYNTNNEEDNSQNITLNIFPLELKFDYKGGEEYINIYCNSDWSIISSNSWCTFSQLSGKEDQKIKIKLSSNYENADRNTNFIITAGDKTQNFSISQTGLDKYFNNSNVWNAYVPTNRKEAEYQNQIKVKITHFDRNPIEINWGDGNIERIKEPQASFTQTHYYNNITKYQISITGKGKARFEFYKEGVPHYEIEVNGGGLTSYETGRSYDYNTSYFEILETHDF